MKKWLKGITEKVNQKSSNDSYSSFWKFLSALLKAVMKEVNSIPGKINIITDILLLVMFISILISTSFNTLFLFVQNIIAMLTNNEINSLDYNVLIICFAIFAFMSICCLIFMHFIIKNENKLDDILLDDESE
ncbi:MAG: hypothetical protein ACI4G0_06980 [Ruminococcus sp.]